MTTLEQAARQALETLERASDAGYSVECDETITALREALEQAAPKAAPGEQACQGARCAATAANGLHHSRECLIEAGQAQGWIPTTTELANAGPSAPAQPAEAAPQQEAQEPCQTCIAMARTVMMDQVSFDRKPDCYGIRQITDDEGIEEWEDIRTSPDVAREEANDMMATGRGEIYEVVPLWTAPQPAPDCHHRPPCDECAAIAAQGGK